MCKKIPKSRNGSENFLMISKVRNRVVMKTGSVAHLSNYQNSNKSTNNKIPDYAKEYKREYQFIRGLNKEFRYLIDKLDNLNNGLFESNTSNRIKNFMKRFLKAQERGKLKDISDLVFPIEYLDNINFINKKFGYYKLRYDFFDDDEKPYPGFKEIYDIFKKIFNQLKFECCDSDSDCDREEFDFPYTESDLEYFFYHLNSFSF